MNRREPKSIGIIGGMGRMGAMLARFFSEAGYAVEIADTKQAEPYPKSITEHDVVILSVPISSIEAVAAQIGPFTREDGVVIDIASVKEEPVRSMRKHCSGDVIGSHPLFGPDIASLKDQVVFVCPYGLNGWIDWFATFFSERGARVVSIDPERHDRLMARVQALRHFLIIAFGRCLLELNFDLSSDLPVSGEWFSQLVRILSRQLEQSPGLYADLAFHNPATMEVVDQFLASVRETASLYESRDRSGLIRLYEDISTNLFPHGAKDFPRSSKS